MRVIIGRTKMNEFGLSTERLEKELLTDLKGEAVLSLREFAKRVKRATIRNIRMGAMDSRYPQTGALAQSVHYRVKSTGKYPTMNITIGEGLPYGENIEAEEGVYTPIWSTGPALSFFWYKIGAPMRINKPGYIKYPGKAPLGRAWEEVLPFLDGILGE